MIKSQTAYTLFELLMSLTLAAVVLGLGLPSFARVVAEHRVRTDVDALFHAFHLARKESITRRRVVTLCPSIDGKNCTGGRDWSAGWIMFVNRDRRREQERAADEELLTFHTPNPEVAIVTNRNAFSLRSIDLRATNGTLRVCDRKSRVAARALIVSYTGRPRVRRVQAAETPDFCAD